MGMLDFLIDKDNVIPKVGVEYIYRLDMVWKPNTLEGFPINKDTIVTNVVQLSNRSYEFNIKGNTEKLRTNYGWALAENTPENLAAIEAYEKEYIKFKEYESFVNSLRNNITTLKP